MGAPGKAEVDRLGWASRVVRRQAWGGPCYQHSRCRLWALVGCDLVEDGMLRMDRTLVLDKRQVDYEEMAKMALMQN